MPNPNHNNAFQGFDIIIDVSKHLNAAAEHLALAVIISTVHKLYQLAARVSAPPSSSSRL